MTEKDLSLTEYGKREDIAALARRLRSMLPGGNKMSTEQAMALAQYAISLDANPFRGEIYGFTSKGRFVLVDGYKILVRWAKRQAPYSERYEPMDAEELNDGDIGFRCWILRQDARATLQEMVQAGADFQTAFEIAATSAVGVVTKADRTTRDGRQMEPPVGWTWEQVAKKRALKNALNLSHGAPSPREIARESWLIGDTATIEADWISDDVTPGMTGEERARLAALHAQAREEQPDDRSPEEVLEHNRAILHPEQTEMEI